jgi:hypothetical protein
MGHTEADVRRTAYELWERRGKGDHHDWDDWYGAELALDLERTRGQKMRPPAFRAVEPDEILSQVEISHAGICEFFCPAHSWIETAVDLQTVFEFDSNRRLHFDEGLLNAARRVAMDLSITRIAEDSHFPYRDLPSVRRKVGEFTALYRSRAHLPPPLFFYPAPCQLEILDGVHRTIAACQVMRDCGSSAFTIWLGFNHQSYDAGLVVQQLWADGMRRLRAGR